MCQSLYQIQSLDYRYSNGTMALRNINVTIHKNQRVALVGSNGAGKSTFIQHLNGLLKPTKGRIYFEGNPIDYHRKNLNQIRQKVGIVLQDPDAHLFSPDVLDELIFGPINFGMEKDEAIKNAYQIMDNLGLKHLIEQPTHHLSYGQKKQVSIASILVSKPDVIILDEPMAGLDPYNRQLVMRSLDHLYQQGITIVLSTHDVNLAYEWAEEVIAFSNGHCIGQGDPITIFSNEILLKEAHLACPMVLDLYNNLPDKLKKQIPRNHEQLKLLLQNA
ncbi:energy-coupling factor ABC transporter ATP-binding protein [Vallitalea okinawensis]|uniref:energy-coupling factor ABC transporter ATP-binding protein n=1 Tax=Vallitalea okinawensis TaxID=2078660 RepID=UPI000CFD9691|nr:energy-coupling factor ABC transporter ATP-binding protein [Vallitalea okinawensis]